MYTYYAHTFIDSVQSTKKQFVQTFVPQTQLASILNSFVDAQTKYTKAAFDASSEAGTSLHKLVTSKEFQNDVMHMVQEHLQSILPAIYKSGK